MSGDKGEELCECCDGTGKVEVTLVDSSTVIQNCEECNYIHNLCMHCPDDGGGDCNFCNGTGLDD